MQKKCLVPVICFVLLCFSAATFAQEKTTKSNKKSQKTIKVVEKPEVIQEDIPPPHEERKIESTNNSQMESGSGIEPMVVAEPENTAPDNEIYSVAEQQAEFPGGQREMMRYIFTNIKYPAVAKENAIQGRVILRLVIEKDGSIGNIIIIKGVHELLNNEAIRIVKSMPNWTPAKQGGKIVRSNFVLPVTFTWAEHEVKKD